MSDAPKKGNVSWKPPKRLNLKGKRPGMRYRWVLDDPLRLQWMEDAGWAPATFVQGDKSTRAAQSDATPLTGSKAYRGMVPMMIPQEEYEKHRAYYEEQTRRQTMGLKQRANEEIKSKVGPRAHLDGKIIIE